METTVIFYKEEGNGVVACFPFDHEKPGHCACYSHIGQHSYGSGEYFNGLKKATKKEYQDLQSELENRGYKLKVI